jgi:hypothetical protein
MVADRFRQTILRPEEVNRTCLAVAVCENSSRSPFIWRQPQVALELTCWNIAAQKLMCLSSILIYGFAMSANFCRVYRFNAC